MIKFEDKSLGKVVIRFRPTLPSVVVPNQNNSLASIVDGIKLNQGRTECTVNIDCDDRNDPLYQFYGQAMTHPTDHYKKETGRILSLTRAVEAMVDYGAFSDADGRAVMSEYYAR